MEYNQRKQYANYWGSRKREEEGDQKQYEEIMAENFPNLKKEI